MRAEVKSEGQEKADQEVVVNSNLSIGLKYGVKDEDGSVLLEEEAQCYTWQFMRTLICLWLYSIDISLTGVDQNDLSKLTEHLQNQYELMELFGANSMDNNQWKQHISLGTWPDGDTNPLTSKTMYSMYKPYDIIPNGSGDNQLEYGSSDTSAGVSDDTANGNWTYTITRTFTNQGTVDVNAKSIHFHYGGHDMFDYQNLLILIARDIFSSPITISPGSQKTFYYQFTISTDDITGEWSLVKQFLSVLREGLRNNGDDYDFSLKNISSDTEGIVASTDDTQLSANPIGLQSPISSGIGSNELLYSGTYCFAEDENAEPSGLDWQENVYKIKNTAGSLDSTNNQLDDSDMDFVSQGVTTSDYVWIEGSSNGQNGYYSVTSVNDGYLDLGESISTDESITYWIANEENPKTSISIRRTVENQSGGPITVNKVYLVDKNGNIIGGKYLKHGSTSDGDSEDSSVDIADGDVARFVYKITLVPDN